MKTKTFILLPTYQMVELGEATPEQRQLHPRLILDKKTGIVVRRISVEDLNALDEVLDTTPIEVNTLGTKLFIKGL